MGVVDRLAADLRAQASVERNPVFTAVQRVHPAADPRPRFEHDDVPSRVAQIQRRGETGEAGPDDDDPPRRAWVRPRCRAHNRLAGLRRARGRDGNRRGREEPPP